MVSDLAVMSAKPAVVKAVTLQYERPCGLRLGEICRGGSPMRRAGELRVQAVSLDHFMSTTGSAVSAQACSGGGAGAAGAGRGA